MCFEEKISETGSGKEPKKNTVRRILHTNTCGKEQKNN